MSHLNRVRCNVTLTAGTGEPIIGTPQAGYDAFQPSNLTGIYTYLLEANGDVEMGHLVYDLGVFVRKDVVRWPESAVYFDENTTGLTLTLTADALAYVAAPLYNGMQSPSASYGAIAIGSAATAGFGLGEITDSTSNSGAIAIGSELRVLEDTGYSGYVQFSWVNYPTTANDRGSIAIGAGAKIESGSEGLSIAIGAMAYGQEGSVALGPPAVTHIGDGGVEDPFRDIYAPTAAYGGAVAIGRGVTATNGSVNIGGYIDEGSGGTPNAAVVLGTGSADNHLAAICENQVILTPRYTRIPFDSSGGGTTLDSLGGGAILLKNVFDILSPHCAYPWSPTTMKVRGSMKVSSAYALDALAFRLYKFEFVMLCDDKATPRCTALGCPANVIPLTEEFVGANSPSVTLTLDNDVGVLQLATVGTPARSFAGGFLEIMMY